MIYREPILSISYTVLRCVKLHVFSISWLKKNKEKRKSKNGDSFLVQRGLVNPKNWYEKLKFMKKCEKT